MRLSQIHWYLNADKHPTKDELEFYYTHMKVTDELKKIRGKHRRKLREQFLDVTQPIPNPLER